MATIQRNQDGDSMLLSVIGQEIIAERTGTVFEDTSFDALAVGDVIEVSGFPNGAGQLRATRIERKGDFVDGQTEVEATGEVTSLTATTFSLNEFTVDYANADLSNVAGGTLQNGMVV